MTNGEYRDKPFNNSDVQAKLVWELVVSLDCEAAGHDAEVDNRMAESKRA